MAVDVLGLGCCAVDDILYVDHYPAADSKIEVCRRERRCGGLTAVALMSAAQFGASCQFAGTLGGDELSRFVLGAMRDQGVDTSTTIVRAEARPVHSTIIVDERTGARTILYGTHGVFGADETQPSAELIRSARVLFIDQYGITGAIRAARIARGAGIPVVADLEAEHLPRFAELLNLVDHLILSRDFAARITGQSDPANAAHRLWNEERAAVVVTAGKEGCFYIDRNSHKPQHCPAFSVATVDTTGCGDVFHGVYAAALSRDLPLLERLRLASAAAALKAARAVGHSGIPTAGEITRFLNVPH